MYTIQIIHYAITKPHVLLHAWITVYANSHFSAAGAEAGIELQDAEPTRSPSASGRGQPPLVKVHSSISCLARRVCLPGQNQNPAQRLFSSSLA